MKRFFTMLSACDKIRRVGTKRLKECLAEARGADKSVGDQMQGQRRRSAEQCKCGFRCAEGKGQR